MVAVAVGGGSSSAAISADRDGSTTTSTTTNYDCNMCSRRGELAGDELGRRRKTSNHQCGLCSLVAQAIRRAVCGGGGGASRRDSAESYQELTAPNVTSPPAGPDGNKCNLVSVDVNDENTMYIKMIGATLEEDEKVPLLLTDGEFSGQRFVSKEDGFLLNEMDTVPAMRCTGRFLTMHKRRRKKLTTRSLSNEHHHNAILDDVHHGQVERILSHCGDWAFNAFTLENVAGGRALSVLCVHLFHWYGLLDYFQLDVVRVWKLFTLIEDGYHSTNPYHNSIHATDVTQAMHCFLQEEKIRKNLTPLEVMASLIGAVAHDLDHPGVNQHFLISTSNHLATLYQNSSVLENHHWRSAIGCLLESGVAEQLAPYRGELELQIRDLILATDINRQQEFLTKFKAHLDDDTLDLTRADDRNFILQIALKCADISNPTRPWDISQMWSLKVCEEFFRQGEFERQLQLPVTSLCDQQSTSVAKIQVGFFHFVVQPLFNEWHRFLKSILSTHMMDILLVNRKNWERQQQEPLVSCSVEVVPATPFICCYCSDSASIEEEPTAAGSVPQSSSSSAAGSGIVPLPVAVHTSGRRDSLAVPTKCAHPQQHHYRRLHSTGVMSLRRHSVPIHLQAGTSSSTSSKDRPTDGCSHKRTNQLRRDSVPLIRSQTANLQQTPPQSQQQLSNVSDEDDMLKFGSQSSMTSWSSPYYYSSVEDQLDRPLSAENLLPDPSIASMTSSEQSAGRLSSILQATVMFGPASAGSGSASYSSQLATAATATTNTSSRNLIRQQTFPPPQSTAIAASASASCLMRQHQHNMSTTSDVCCTEPLLERDDTSVQSDELDTTAPTPQISILSPSNSSGQASTPDSYSLIPSIASSNNHKDFKKSIKATGFHAPPEKENLDPKRRYCLNIYLNRRRGSAPLPRVYDRTTIPPQGPPPAGGGLPPQPPSRSEVRRGSVPIDIGQFATCNAYGGGQEQQDSCSTDSTNLDDNDRFPLLRSMDSTTRALLLKLQFKRRGSAPLTGTVSATTTTNTMPKDKPLVVLTRHISLNGRGRKKKPLKRRSSGGPETLHLPDSFATAAGRMLVRHVPGASMDSTTETLLIQRRGSLPVEVLTVGHSVF